ncbi:hypothetical protein M8818_006067 [Zalaria obscura]|uniref:Uncharacterized protein n=1 Tax=Zalaria obscura TaxID=2024903 RepID=A0ACC3S7R6_9PEZI
MEGKSMDERRDSAIGGTKNSASQEVLTTKSAGNRPDEQHSGPEHAHGSSTEHHTALSHFAQALDKLSVVWNPGDAVDWAEQDISALDRVQQGAEHLALALHDVCTLRCVQM